MGRVGAYGLSDDLDRDALEKGESDPIVAEGENDDDKARLLGIARDGKMVRWKRAWR